MVFGRVYKCRHCGKEAIGKYRDLGLIYRLVQDSVVDSATPLAHNPVNQAISLCLVFHNKAPDERLTDKHEVYDNTSDSTIIVSALGWKGLSSVLKAYSCWNPVQPPSHKSMPIFAVP